MIKNLILSLDNPKVLGEKYNLLAGEWVQETSDLSEKDCFQNIFSSRSDLKKKE